jgi:hypothetical protein
LGTRKIKTFPSKTEIRETKNKERKIAGCLGRRSKLRKSECQKPKGTPKVSIKVMRTPKVKIDQNSESLPYGILLMDTKGCGGQVRLG